MTDYLDAVEQQLLLAARREFALRGAGDPSSRTQPRRRMRLPPKRRVGMALLTSALLLMTGTALALTGVIQLGAPAQIGSGGASEELGAADPTTAHVLPITAADPGGGPEWGLEVYTTARGVGCIQAGRIVDGRLGAIGRDSAFGDDGRFHELPITSPTKYFSCSALDAKGRIFNNVMIGDIPASAWTGSLGCIPATSSVAEKQDGAPATVCSDAQGGCVPATATAAERTGPYGQNPAICPQADERNLYYGLLGPDAESITYLASDGHLRTQPTSGEDGAYLIVTDASPQQQFNFNAGGTSGVFPVDGPITEIHYRDGSACYLTSAGPTANGGACNSSMVAPVGYEPVPTPSAQEVAAPVQANVKPATRGGGYEIEVSFVSRIPITDARSKYVIKYDGPEGSEGSEGSDQLSGEADEAEDTISAGQPVTLSLRSGHGLGAGAYSGTVSLMSATGPEMFEGPGTVYAPVGQFSVTVP